MLEIVAFKKQIGKDCTMQAHLIQSQCHAKQYIQQALQDGIEKLTFLLMADILEVWCKGSSGAFCINLG